MNDPDSYANADSWTAMLRALSRLIPSKVFDISFAVRVYPHPPLIALVIIVWI